MGKNIKLCTTRGFVVVALTILLAYLFATNSSHLQEYIAIYYIVLHYMFDSGGETQGSNTNKS